MTDDRIEAEEAVEPSPETTSDSGEYLATVSRPVDEQNVMNLSVEQAGAAAEEDDPTADYVATSPSASGLFTAAGEIDAVPEGDDETTVADAAAVDSALSGAARPAEAGLLSVDEDEMLVIDDDDRIVIAHDVGLSSRVRIRRRITRQQAGNSGVNRLDLGVRGVHGSLLPRTPRSR